MSSFQRRINPSPALWALLEQFSVDQAVHPDDVLDALIASALADSETARHFLVSPDAAPEGPLEPTNQTEIQAKISSLGASIDVVGIRLGATNPDDEQTGPWNRTNSGCDIGETDTATLWASARGWWAIAPRASFLVAYRVGQPLRLFGGVVWSAKDLASGRRYAVEGYAIVDGQRWNPEDGALLGAASELEQRLERIVFAHRLVMPASASNPVAYIS